MTKSKIITGLKQAARHARERNMRKDFDYVDLKDYESDMNELGEQASNVIAALKQGLDQERRDKNRLIATIVLAAGGRLEIATQHLIDAYDAEIRQWRDEANNVTVIEVVASKPE